MQEKLLAEFPEVSYETWREQVQKDLKGADFEKRLVARTLEGVTVQPLYAAQDVPGEDAGGFAGLAPYRRGAVSVGNYGSLWDVRAEQRNPDLQSAAAEAADDLARGARSLWLRFDRNVRLGSAAHDAGGEPNAGGLPCADRAEFEALLANVALEQVTISYDAGANAAALAAALFAQVERRGVAAKALQGTLGCDPLGALACDGALPYSLETARALLLELRAYLADHAPRLRTAVVSTVSYHDAGASSMQEIAYALATGLEYLRWLMSDGTSLAEACRALEFRVGVSSDLFVEIAKLRALRLCWAKVVAALGGDDSAQNTHVHAVTAQRTKTQRDPWVNMLRTTTEAFSAMVGGADALTTRGFDETLGISEPFARRIARNTQIILNEEAHVTRVVDAAGGSYYVETLTDALARGGWRLLQEVERRGGMSAALLSGAIAKEVAELADKRAAACAKRSSAITGISEFANLNEEPVRREAPSNTTPPATRTSPPAAAATLVRLAAAESGSRIGAAIEAARQGAPLEQITSALAGSSAPARCAALPLRRQAAPFEGLRARSERHAAISGKQPLAFLCNLGAIPQHKARASFATGFLAAGGISVLDNDGFATQELALEAFAASGSTLAVICGSDDQYPEWVPTLALALRERGAQQVILAGRPGEHEVAYQQAGVSLFIYLGLDVVATLTQLLDSMGVSV